ncbi:MAG: YqgE/AlgH family protein [Parabacteroides sp.]|nr:YqgE/AlgH family protein [Parabacteroides sp.]
MDKDIHAIKHKGILPRQGRILISEPLLSNPYFQRSVVLLVDHSQSGSMGFVVNKKLDLTVNEFFPELKNKEELPIFIGGPVSSNRLFFIHSLGELIIPDSVKISDNLFFDGDFEVLKKFIMAGNSVEGSVRFFLGYSGWEKGQLMQEIKEDSWVVNYMKEPKNIFFAEGEDFWKNSVTELGNNYNGWIRYPREANLN